MKVLGLTGSIAAGKSTVAQMLVAKGAKLIDADVLAREVIAPGTEGLAEVARRFPGVVGPDGALDRKALGDRIFGHEAERLALNAIVHPRVQAAMIERSAAYAAEGAPVVVYDAALMIENRLHEAMEGVILVTAPPAVQKARLIARNALTPEQADARIAAQMPQDEKRKFATWEIDNGGTREATQRQVDALWPKLVG